MRTARSGKRRWAVLACALAFCAACAQKEMPVPSVTAPDPDPLPPASEQSPARTETPASVQAALRQETGTASWYGREQHGRKTASGELFDMYGLSAAHRTLEFGTEITVTNLINGRSVKLTVNDRGPFSGDRILEVSYGAARELGFVARGTAPVKIESRERQEAGPYSVQAAVFAEEESAKLLRERLSAKFMTVWTVPFRSNLGNFYRVFVGSYQTMGKAETIAGKLKLEGLEPFVVRKD